MRLVVVAPGRPTHPAAIQWCADFQERISRLVPFERRAGKAIRRTRAGVDSAARTKECDAILELIPPQSQVVLLDVVGQGQTSDQLLHWLTARAEQGVREVCCVLGGPDGVDDRVRARANLRLSLSAMTLPHDLAEVVLLEQLYRALTRQKGLPYHR